MITNKEQFQKATKNKTVLVEVGLRDGCYVTVQAVKQSLINFLNRGHTLTLEDIGKGRSHCPFNMGERF